MTLIRNDDGLTSNVFPRVRVRVRARDRRFLFSRADGYLLHPKDFLGDGSSGNPGDGFASG